MSSFLDGEFDVAGERKERNVKRIVFGVLMAIAVAASIFVLQINHRQKGRINEFVARLKTQDYQGAYLMWGCTEVNPCPDYKYEKFLEDWGPKSKHAQISNYSIQRTCACGTGVLITLGMAPGGEEKLWVESANGTIGFAPWPTCRPKPLLCFLPV